MSWQGAGLGDSEWLPRGRVPQCPSQIRDFVRKKPSPRAVVRPVTGIPAPPSRRRGLWKVAAVQVSTCVFRLLWGKLLHLKEGPDVGNPDIT